LPAEISVSELPGRLVLLGHPVDHSLSPIFQNAALQAAKIPLTYEALDVPPRELRVLLRQLKDQNAAGNVTIPTSSRCTPAAMSSPISPPASGQ